MPEIDLSDLIGLSTSSPSPIRQIDEETGSYPIMASIKLISIMSWPDDASKRNQFISSFTSGVLHELSVDSVVKKTGLSEEGAEYAKDLIENFKFEISDKFFIPNGGYGAVRSAPAWDALKFSIDTMMPKWRVVGRIVQYLFSIEKIGGVRGGASLNKAVYIIENTHLMGVKKRTEIMSAWKKYKSVSHIFAAMLHFEEIGEEIFFGSLHWMLSLARLYAIFLMEHVPHGMKKPILDADGIWLIPSWISLPPFQAIPPLALSDDQISVLKRYRAPQAY